MPSVLKSEGAPSPGQRRLVHSQNVSSSGATPPPRRAPHPSPSPWLQATGAQYLPRTGLGGHPQQQLPTPTGKIPTSADAGTPPPPHLLPCLSRVRHKQDTGGPTCTSPEVSSCVAPRRLSSGSVRLSSFPDRISSAVPGSLSEELLPHGTLAAYTSVSPMSPLGTKATNVPRAYHGIQLQVAVNGAA